MVEAYLRWFANWSKQPAATKLDISIVLNLFGRHLDSNLYCEDVLKPIWAVLRERLIIITPLISSGIHHYSQHMPGVGALHLRR